MPPSLTQLAAEFDAYSNAFRVLLVVLEMDAQDKKEDSIIGAMLANMRAGNVDAGISDVKLRAITAMMDDLEDLKRMATAAK